MARRKKKKGLSLLIDMIAGIISGIIKLLIAIIMLPYTIYKKVTAEREEEIVETPSKTTTELLYKRKYLLTKHEWSFYKQLKPVADKLGLTILAKIRVADLVDPVADHKSDYYKSFAKVRSKHVDFALARPDNLYVELLIELDDSSHIAGNERDAFVEWLYREVGYKLYRTRSGYNLEQDIKDALGLNIESQPTTQKPLNEDASIEELKKEMQ